MPPKMLAKVVSTCAGKAQRESAKPPSQELFGARARTALLAPCTAPRSRRSPALLYGGSMAHVREDVHIHASRKSAKGHTHSCDDAMLIG